MAKLLDELEKLSKAATPGPWGPSIGLSGVIPIKDHNAGFDCRRQDAELIAAMRNNIDQLLEIAKAASYLCKNPYEDFRCGINKTALDVLKMHLNKLERDE